MSTTVKKNLLAIGLSLFGSTYWWMTTPPPGDTPLPSAIAWTLVNGLALLAGAGFLVSAVAAFKKSVWWLDVGFPSAGVGMIAVIPFVVGLRRADAFADLGVQINLWSHIAGNAVMIAIVAVPAAQDWVMDYVDPPNGVPGSAAPRRRAWMSAVTARSL